MRIREAIHYALISLVDAGPFRPVKWEDGSRRMTVDPEACVQPSSVGANEDSSSFAAGENRRDASLTRVSLRWELHLHFPVEVDGEEWEDAVAHRGSLDLGPGRPALRITDIEANYNHPARQPENKGSRLVYTITFGELPA